MNVKNDKKHVYLDSAATSPISRDINDFMYEISQKYSANASSQHNSGRQAAQFLEKQREILSDKISCSKDQIIFTSGGTESNSLVIHSFLWKKKKGSVIFSGIEHPSIFEYKNFLEYLGFKVIFLKAENGFISKRALKNALQEDTCLVSIMLVNNVIGSINNIFGLTEIIRDFEKLHKKHIHIHTDAVQAFGKIPLSAAHMDIDSLSISAHKIHGPKGIGALYMKKPLHSISMGGGQEFGKRPGTENIAGASGLAMAAVDSIDNIGKNWDHAEIIKQSFIKGAEDIPYIQILSPCNYTATYPEFISKNGFTDDSSAYSPYILLVSVSPIPAEVFLRVLNDHGIEASAGSACSSSSAGKRERVLDYMGFNKDIITGAVRFSFSSKTSLEDIHYTLKIIEEFCTPIYDMLR
ncbi:MAG: aminotransferase class V-fold PLP-dependent enzyme [Spirochaetia bacterium]|nr:aminotransferase class V-fold PLP-dependent enzyme [Spirochaetia bacterium]